MPQPNGTYVLLDKSVSAAETYILLDKSVSVALFVGFL
jgi:hypothetical protein